MTAALVCGLVVVAVVFLLVGYRAGREDGRRDVSAELVELRAEREQLDRERQGYAAEQRIVEDTADALSVMREMARRRIDDTAGQQPVIVDGELVSEA